MADRSDIRFKAGQAAGQTQVKRDDLMNRASQSEQETNEQAAGFLQQTGDQAKNMAQEATDAMKNAVRMGDNASNTAATRTTVTRH